MIARSSAWIATATIAALVGCGESAPVADAAIDAALPFAIEPPAPPEAPALPTMAPCPDGWIERDSPIGTACEPFAEPPQCEDDEVAIPGVGCAPIGPDCSGDYAAGLPASGVVYVAPGGTGDGTRSRPLGSIAAALAMRPEHIALARGEHRGPMVIDFPVHVHGACANATRIRSSGDDAPAVGVDGTTATLRDVSIASERSPGVGVRQGELTMSGVIIESAIDYGVLARQGGELHATRLRIGGVTSRFDVIGLGCLDDASCEVEEAMFGPDRGGLLVIQDGMTTLRRSTVLTAPHTRWLATSDRPGTIVLEQVAAATARVVINPGATMRATHTILDAIVAKEATVTLDRCSIPGAIGVGVSVEGSRMVARNVLIGAPAPERLGTVLVAAGISMLDSVLAFDRVAIAGAQTAAFDMHDGSVATGEDLTILGVDGVPASFYGVAVDPGSSFEVERAHVAGFGAVGIAFGEASEPSEHVVALTDVVIDGIDGEEASGIEIADAAIELNRVAIRNAARVALNLEEASTIRATDLEIEDGTHTPRRGADVRGGSVLTLERARFDRASEHSIVVLDETSRVEGTQVSIRESRPRDCDRSSCDTPFGIGLGVYFRGEAALDGFEIDGSAQCGVHLLYGGMVALRNGRLRGHPIALCAEHNTIDLAAVSEGVVYENNDVMLDGASLPVPEPRTP